MYRKQFPLKTYSPPPAWGPLAIRAGTHPQFGPLTRGTGGGKSSVMVSVWLHDCSKLSGLQIYVAGKGLMLADRDDSLPHVRGSSVSKCSQPLFGDGTAACACRGLHPKTEEPCQN